MNQAMTNELTSRIKRENRTPAHRSRDNSTIDMAYDEVAKAVLHRFRTCQYFEIRRVNCEIRQGVLVIHGQVSSYYLKQLAQESIRSLAGVIRIVNRLEVVYPQPSRDESTLERS